MYANPAPNTPPPPFLKVVLLVSECLKRHLGLGMEPKLREVKEERAHSSAAELRFPGAAKMEAEPGLVEAEERGVRREGSRPWHHVHSFRMPGIAGMNSRGSLLHLISAHQEGGVSGRGTGVSYAECGLGILGLVLP